jgi:hypothetical protein
LIVNSLNVFLGILTKGFVQRFGAWRSGGFRSTKLSSHHKC